MSLKKNEGVRDYEKWKLGTDLYQKGGLGEKNSFEKMVNRRKKQVF